ncbi:MAG: hypothetical protein FJ276_29440 [Planctomycetes bacterium]|nr:hypothetical protein [Planctomycetota bacterium]
MAKLLALEWDSREARVAAGSVRGTEIVVEHAFAVALGPGAADESASAADVGRQLLKALTDHGLTGSDALVCLARSNVELRQLSLPPAPPEERPEMVRFQAMQAFTSIGEDWPVDYVELGSTEHGSDVLAAVASPKQVRQVLDVCAAAQVKAHRIVLRPIASSSLLHRRLDRARNRLIVDIMADEADLTAVFGGQVVFMRTVRLPGDAKVQVPALTGELRRTIGAAQNQMGGTRIDQIVICGSQEENAALCEDLSNALSLEVVSFDPLDVVRLSRAVEARRPADAGRFTALLGMLADEAAGTSHAIDFLNPRKRPPVPSKKRRNVAVAAAAVAAVALGVAAAWLQLRRLDDRIAELNKMSSDAAKEVAAAKELIAKTDAIKEFTDGDITWLDELREMARNLPSSEQAILEEVSVGTANTRGGTMVLKGNVKSSELIQAFEDSLRYNNNVVAGRQGVTDPSMPLYPWLLDTVVSVVPDVQDRGRSLGRPFRDAIRKEVAGPTGASEPPAHASPRPADTPANVGQSATPAAATETPAAPTSITASPNAGSPAGGTPAGGTPAGGTPAGGTPEGAARDAAAPEPAVARPPDAKTEEADASTTPEGAGAAPPPSTSGGDNGESAESRENQRS